MTLPPVASRGQPEAERGGVLGARRAGLDPRARACQPPQLVGNLPIGLLVDTLRVLDVYHL